MPERAYIVPAAVYAPVTLTVIAVVVSISVSWWCLVAIPFIWLGSMGAAPNLNLADGCLAFASAIIGLILFFFFKPLGIAICAGVIVSYYASALEKNIRMRPLPDADDV